MVFDELKNTVANLSTKERLCTLIFDLKAILPQIEYNAQRDDLIGYECYGDQKKNKVADHTLVFMVKGVKTNFKQPVACYFTHENYSVKGNC